MNILAFGASTSKSSINQRFAAFAAHKLDSKKVEVLDLSKYQLPIYSVDEESENGVPQDAISFYNTIQAADVLVISMAEHNGSYTAAFKNLFDWATRHELQVFANKPMILLATAPGGRGGLGVLETATDRFPRHGGNVLGTFSLLFFGKNFVENEITDLDLAGQFTTFTKRMKAALAAPQRA